LTKLGVCVAGDTFGVASVVQQWMCAAVTPASNPWKLASMRSVCRAGSIVTVTKPVPGELLGGFSLAPVSESVKTIARAGTARTRPRKARASHFFIFEPPGRQCKARRPPRLAST